MATSVLCRACGTQHDPLLACPSKDALIGSLKKQLAATEALVAEANRELAAARLGRKPFDRVAYQREYMRKWRENLKNRQP